MKKIGLVLTALLISLSLVACSSTKKVDTNQLFKDAYTKTHALSAANLKSTTAVDSTDSDGENTAIEYTITMAANGLDSTASDYEANMVISATMSGKTQELSLYVKDGYGYMSANGSKAKMSVKSALGTVSGAPTDSSTADEIVETLDVTKATVEEKDGAYTYTFEYKTLSDITAFLKKVTSMKSLASSMNGIDEASMIIKVTVKDEYITTTDLQIDATGENDGEVATIKVKVENIDPGKAVTITAPSDLSSYSQTSY